jgi:hypothetical protein
VGIGEKGVKEQRSADALLNRFQRMIQKEMNIFNKHYRYILLSLPSGTVESEYIDKAAERFLEDEGRPFLYKDCVEVLHQLPKFDPMIYLEQDAVIVDDDAEDDDDEEVMSTSDGDKKP